MRASDVTVTGAAVDFERIALSNPMTISGRSIDWFTLVKARVRVRRRDGAEAEGLGSTILSVPWSWPISDRTVEERDEVLRRLVRKFLAQVDRQAFLDPLQLWRRLYASVDETSASTEVEVPRLAALLALGAVDSAVHDGWAKAAGQPAHLLYDAEHLNEDLSFLGIPELSGAYPADFLRTPLGTLPVQHLVGAADPLCSEATQPGERTLIDWLRQDAPRFLKVKTSGLSAQADAERVEQVHRAAATIRSDVALSVDPNEGYRSSAELAVFIELLEQRALPVAFIEQPVPRDSPLGLDASRTRVPIVLDEGFTRIDALPGIRAEGWSGIVIKAGKGQSAALIAHSFARATGSWVTVQDLTAVDAAFAHSARLASIFRLSSPHFEYNSRQYAPSGNDRLAERYPDFTRVRNGEITLPEPAPGIY